MKRYFIALFALLQCLSANPFVKYEYDGYNGHLLTIKDGYEWEIQHSYDLRQWQELDIMIVLDMMVWEVDEVAKTKTYIFWKFPANREFFRLKILSSPPNYLIDAVNSFMVADTGEDDVLSEQHMFNNYTSAATLSRNSNNFLHNKQGVTGLVAWNSKGNHKQFGGGALTKRHVVCTAHAQYQVGDIIYFVTRDDSIISRTVIKTKGTGYEYYDDGDYIIALLDEDLPNTIETLEVLPPDTYRYFDPNNFSFGTQLWQNMFIIWANQQELSTIGQLRAITFGNSFTDLDPYEYNWRNDADFQINYEYFESPFYIKPIAGDSGSVAMMMLGDKLVAIGHIAAAGNGTFFGHERTFNDLNRMISDVDVAAGIDTGYTLTPADLSEYTTFR